jgi:hypothetical protein
MHLIPCGRSVIAHESTIAIEARGLIVRCRQMCVLVHTLGAALALLHARSTGVCPVPALAAAGAFARLIKLAAVPWLQ